MPIEMLLKKYLPMPRKTCYALISVLEPCERTDVCQTVSELSNGEFDQEENLRKSLEELFLNLETDGLIQEVMMDGISCLTLSQLGTKLLICEFNRTQGFHKKNIC